MNFRKKLINYILPRLEDRYIVSQSLLLGRLLSEKVCNIQDIQSLPDVEFKVFSQFGDDGIIQYLINKLQIKNRTFVEFGVSDYFESNTRFLLLKDNWSGLIMDGSDYNINFIKKSDYYWRHDLTAVSNFVTRENINDLILQNEYKGEIGLLHVDLDGNDYWVWEKIDVVDPILVIMEYNSVFGPERNISVPYQENFVRTKAHSSNLYWGASLGALCNLAEKKGYYFIGSSLIQETKKFFLTKKKV